MDVSAGGTTVAGREERNLRTNGGSELEQQRSFQKTNGKKQKPSKRQRRREEEQNSGFLRLHPASQQPAFSEHYWCYFLPQI